MVCVPVNFFLHCRSFSPWDVAASILIFSPSLLNVHVFLPTKLVSFVFFSRSSSFSVNHVNVDIKI